MSIHSSPQNTAQQQHISFRNIMEPLLVLFNKAVALTLKNKEFYIAYSIPGGVYGYFNDYRLTESDAESLQKTMLRMINSGENIRHEVLPMEKILRYFEAGQRADIIHLLRSRIWTREPEGLRLAHLNGHGELLLNHLHPEMEKLKNFRLKTFHKGFFLIADHDFYQKAMPVIPGESKYFAGFEETENTMMHLGIASFAELNDIIAAQRLPEFIKLAEAYQTRCISNIADEIVAGSKGPKLVFLAGPTSSGKTTSANRIAIELKVMRKEVLILSLDNYYLPHAAIPNDPATGMKNFELISSLDLDLFRRNIHDLMGGSGVHLPKYSFDGKGAIPAREKTQLHPEGIVIVEGIHGLNPELWKQTMDVESYRLYVSALSTLNIHDHLPLSTSDLRLIRRLVRDHLFRGYSVNETISRWPDIVQNEYKSIFPFQESAHRIFNSSLVYEPAVFAHYAPAIFKRDMAENQIISEEIARLSRILSLLTPINPNDIPPTSILREFIGGSSFNY